MMIMSLTRTLYNSLSWNADENRTELQETPVVRLVQDLEIVAAEHGLTVSRWQTNHGGFRTTITWAVHRGERPARSTDLPTESNHVVLSQTEGRTERCEAYKAILTLLNWTIAQ